MNQRQNWNEWCIIQKVLESMDYSRFDIIDLQFIYNVFKFWMDVQSLRDRANMDLGLTIMSQYYCSCTQKLPELAVPKKVKNPSPPLSTENKSAPSPGVCMTKENSPSGAFQPVNKEKEEKRDEKKLNHKDENIHLDKLHPQEQQKEENDVLNLVKSNSKETINDSNMLEEDKTPGIESDATSNVDKSSQMKEVNLLKVGETQKLSCAPESVTSHTKDKPKKYSLRLDVVKKTIFRSLKKFYNIEWKDHCKRNIKESEEVFEEAKKYITKIFTANESIQMHLYLVALIDNKKRYNHSDAKYVELRTQIASMLSCFNKNKIDALLKFPEFAKLVLYFLNQPVEETFKDRNDPEVLKVYESQVEELKAQCQEHLTNSS